MRDEWKELGVCEELARVDVDERVETRGGSERDERRKIDRVIDGHSGSGSATRRETREKNQRTTLTQTKRRFFEPTRSK